MIHADMTPLQIEEFLNSIDFSSIEPSIERDYVRHLMMKKIQESVPEATMTKTDGSSFYLILKSPEMKGCSLDFSVSVKSTGKTESVSRLRKRDVMRPGKISLKGITASFSPPAFSEETNRDYSVRVVPGGYSGELLEIPIRKTMSIREHMSSQEVLDFLEKSKENMVLIASQPWIKARYFASDFSKEEFEQIKDKVRERNTHLFNDIIQRDLHGQTENA